MKKSAETNKLIHSDIDFVEGVACRNPRVEKAFYLHCRRYFEEHCQSVFFVGEVDLEDIFQNTFITVWQSIERGNLRVRDGAIIGRNGNTLKCSLTTYLMSVARIKYLEQVRSSENKECFTDLPSDDMLNDCENFMSGCIDDDHDNAMFDIISECISHMSEGCCKILTKFYYEKKKLDDILIEIPQYNSKDALKSNKNRCLNRLRSYALKLYKKRKSK